MRLELLFIIALANSIEVSLIPSTGLPPLPRDKYAALYSERYNSIIIFGGINGIVLLNDI